jgi:hypothetical protein
MIYNVALSYYNQFFKTSSLENNQEFTFKRNNDQTVNPLLVNVESNQSAEISLKCFKYIPPPPSFKPCPEAGTIKVHPKEPATFNLITSLCEEKQHYDLNVKDDESQFNLKLNFI